MGSGASAEVKEQLSAASAEEVKDAVGALSDEQKQEIRAALAAQKLEWKECFVIFGQYTCKDIPLMTKAALTDAHIQVKEEPRAPRFAVMGTSTNDAPADAKDNVFWLAEFENEDAWSGADHKERATNKNDFVPNYMASGASADEGMPGMLKDMAGSYTGTAFHIEKLGEPSGENSVFTCLVKCKAKDEDSAEKIVEAIKANSIVRLDAEEYVLRYTVWRQKNMVGPLSKNDLEVRWVVGLKTKEDFTKYKGATHLAVKPQLKELIAADDDALTLYEFAGTKHFQK